MVRGHAPACCGDNTAHGFVLAVETRQEGDEVIGTRFQTTLVDAIGVAHAREMKYCPACNLDLLIGRSGHGVPCVSVDAWESTLTRAITTKLTELIEQAGGHSEIEGDER